MDKLESIKTLLGEKELETLTFFAKKAEECNSQHLAWKKKHTVDLRLCDDVIIEYSDFAERFTAIEALATLQYVSFRSVGDDTLGWHHLTLLPAALYRVSHESKSKLGRWLGIFMLQYKDFLLWWGFLIPLILTVIRIIEYLNK